MVEMPCRARIVAAFEHREPARTPAYDLLRNEGAIRHYAGEVVDFDNWPTVVPRAISRCLDLTRSIDGPARPRRIEREDGSVDIVERWTVWRTVKSIRSVEDLLASFRRSAEAPPPSRDDLARAAEAAIQWHVDWQAKCQPCLQLWQIGGVGLMGAHGLAGLELFCYAMYDDPATVAAYLEATCQRHVERIHAIFSRLDPDLKKTMAPVCFVGDDVAYKSGCMFSPEFMAQQFYPYLKRICDAYHEHGIWVMFHSDGDLNAMLDHLVAAGIDGLNPIERNANMDLADLKARCGDRVTFCGGVDIHVLMRYGSTAAVIEGTQQAILDAGRDGGFLCGSSTELDDDLPAENVIAMLETIRASSYQQLAKERGR